MFDHSTYVVPFDRLYAIATKKDDLDLDEILIGVRRDLANDWIELITASLKVHRVRYDTIEQILYDQTMGTVGFDPSSLGISDDGHFLLLFKSGYSISIRCLLDG